MTDWFPPPPPSSSRKKSTHEYDKPPEDPIRYAKLASEIRYLRES